MAVVQRDIEDPCYQDEEARDFSTITAIFGRPKTESLRLRVRFIMLDAKVDPDNLIMATKRDGEWYVGLTAFFIYTYWDGKQIKVNVPGCNTVVIPNGQVYQKGVAGYQDGYNYVKVSALGMRATLKGETLEIEHRDGYGPEIRAKQPECKLFRLYDS